ncbi:uncharacterized protein LOC132063994 [Lycium ferocissimum]|uniref:uncharacterized protein LOC132063994 n=1 Tax=Lycium ferocissimum TaxID=112874 RepID=UPI0028163698|nr:uncharacterized protein LOC132063994 [Lycium ferocissimum]
MASSALSPLARLSLERRPKLLKEFLLQDDQYSSSPNDFRSKNAQLLRSRSSRAATATISAINKVINIVKFLPFASVKSPSILPRSISRKLSRKTNNYKKSQKPSNNIDQNVSVPVKVKDILRWKSFRDLVEEKSTPLDSSYSPYRCATTTTTTSTSTTSSKRTSWCDSDFTAEDLPSWWGENGEFLGELEDGMNKVGRKDILEESSTVGGYCMGTTKSINKEELCFDENEQHSPVSVLESPFQQDDEEGIMAFSFHRNLANLDKRKSMLMERIQQFESLAEEKTSFKEEDEEIQEIEEKAKQLLINFKEMEDYEANHMDDDQLLFDFFWNELITSRKVQNNVHDEKLMKEVKSRINGDYNGEFEWEIEDKRDAYIKDMERVAKWNKFEEEKQELTLDLEFEVFNDLIREVLEDVFSRNC